MHNFDTLPNDIKGKNRKENSVEANLNVKKQFFLLTETGAVDFNYQLCLENGLCTVLLFVLWFRIRNHLPFKIHKHERLEPKIENQQFERATPLLNRNY